MPTQRQTPKQMQEEILTSFKDRLSSHEDREMAAWEKVTGFQTAVGQSIITLNHEMGEVQAELRIIRWLMGGSVLVMLTQLVLNLFGK